MIARARGEILHGEKARMNVKRWCLYPAGLSVTCVRYSVTAGGRFTKPALYNRRGVFERQPVTLITTGGMYSEYNLYFLRGIPGF